jgi:uncharacterized protein YjeT (DUF2065 family)
MSRKLFRFAGLFVVVVGLLWASAAPFLPNTPEPVQPWAGVSIPYYAFFAFLFVSVGIIISVWPELWKQLHKFWAASRWSKSGPENQG